VKLAWNRNKIDQLHAKSVFGLARWLARCNQLASHWCTRLPLNPGECKRFSLVANNSHRISKRTRLVPRRIVTYRTPFSPPDLRADSLFAAGLTCGLSFRRRTYVRTLFSPPDLRVDLLFRPGLTCQHPSVRTLERHPPPRTPELTVTRAPTATYAYTSHPSSSHISHRPSPTFRSLVQAPWNGIHWWIVPAYAVTRTDHRVGVHVLV